MHKSCFFNKIGVVIARQERPKQSPEINCLWSSPPAHQRAWHGQTKAQLIKPLIVFFLLIIPLKSQAGDDSLKATIDSFSRPNTSIGVMVHDIKTTKELFSHRGNTPLNPASCMKLITSTVALRDMGGSFKYNTTLSTDRISNNTAFHLYIKGSGDPSMVEERLWRIAKDLKVRGINKIEGDIIIDNTFFDSFDFSGKDDASSRAYNAKLSPFAVNFNSFAVVASNIDGKLEVHVDPPTDHFKLTSKIKPAGNSMTISRQFAEGTEYVTASGGVSDEKIKYANASDPVQYAGTTFAWVLKQMGIDFAGKITSGNARGPVVLLKDKSKELSLILRDLNKFSNNFTAEMVLKTVAANRQGAPGSTEKGVVLLKDFVSALGIDSSEYAIFNGSGLSQRNHLSPNVLNRVLIAAYQNNKIRSDFMSSLSIAGVDGTLGNRLKADVLKGNVKGKTGTLSDVSALAGYLETRAKNMVAFTILVNGPAAGAGGYFAMQEKLLLDIYESY